MKWIYISPHLDDAVLSAGGWIYEKTRAGDEVEIWTLVCGFPQDAELSPFAQLLHFQWGISAAEDVARARRAEDVNAAQILGARTKHFDFLDCIYRRGKDGAWLYSDVFVPPHEDEAELPAQIADAIRARIHPEDRLVCQFAIGAHVDHVLARRAVEMLQRPLTYTADLPYLFNSPDDLTPQTAGLQEITQPISSAAVEAWQAAIEKYESQISSLFDSVDDMHEKIARYVLNNKGLKLWTLP